MAKRYLLRKDGKIQRYNIKHLKKYTKTGKFVGRANVWQKRIGLFRYQVVYNYQKSKDLQEDYNLFAELRVFIVDSKPIADREMRLVGATANNIRKYYLFPFVGMQKHEKVFFTAGTENNVEISTGEFTGKLGYCYKHLEYAVPNVSKKFIYDNDKLEERLISLKGHILKLLDKGFVVIKRKEER
jgi:hypothetical protein